MFIKKIIIKGCWQRMKYGRGKDYDQLSYWSDRLGKYQFNIRGVGHEGKSEESNEELYAMRSHIFQEMCGEMNIDFSHKRVLEIGCGTGFYTGVLQLLGARNITCLDITDTLFEDLKKKFSGVLFQKLDVTSQEISGHYDIVVMIDVVEHIVSYEKFSRAMKNIKECLNSQGIFIVNPICPRERKRKLFHVQDWSLDSFRKEFPKYHVVRLEPFVYNQILVLQSLI